MIGRAYQPPVNPNSCARDLYRTGGRGVFSLVDDNSVKDLPSSAAEIAAGFQNPNAFYIGNAELEAINIRSRRRCCASSGETSGSCRRASRWTCCASRSGAWSFRCPGTPAPVTRTTRLWILHPTTLIRPTPTLSLTSLELSADAGVESPAGARDEVRVAPLADHLMTTR